MVLHQPLRAQAGDEGQVDGVGRLELLEGLAVRAREKDVAHGDEGGGLCLLYTSFALVVGKSALELILGGPPFRRKLDQAARVVAELESRGAKAEAIMLDNDTRPERVVVRMR